MSATLEDLLTDQVDNAGLIERFWKNLLKVGKEKLSLSLLEQRKILLENYWTDFRNTHRKIMRNKDSYTSDYVTSLIYDRVEEAYLQTNSNIINAISKLIPPESKSPPSTTIQATNQSNSVHIELPRVDLPVFYGDSLQWETFRVLFRSIIHDNASLSKSRKLLYLKSCLKGEAAVAILNTPVSDAAYDYAWTTLETRYGNKRILTFGHFRNLLSCPSSKRSSAQELKRLLDTFRQSILAFQALDKPIAQWDEWFVYLLVQKLDSATHLDWETSLEDSTTVPLFKTLESFLENRINALEARTLIGETSAHLDIVKKCKNTRGFHSYEPHSSSIKKDRASTFSTSTDFKKKYKRVCPLCSASHTLSFCAKFKKISPLDRKDSASNLGLCLNCLSTGHLVNSCTVRTNCLVCDSRHHTLLHDSFQKKGSQPGLQQSQIVLQDSLQKKGSPSSIQQNPTSLRNEEISRLENVRFPPPPSTSFGTSGKSLNYALQTSNVILLATARVKLVSSQGRMISARALLDTASDSTIVTEWVVQALNLSTKPVNIEVSGIRDTSAGFARSSVSLAVRSYQDHTFDLPISAIVLPKLTSPIPHRPVMLESWPHLSGLTLADPDFAIPARIDIILGADVCGQLLLNETREGPSGTPIAKLSPFGWVLMGPTSTAARHITQTSTFSCITQDPLSLALRHFWEVEEVSSAKPLSEEEELCESHFQNTHFRDSSGRYVVRLPFRNEDACKTLALSRIAAENRWFSCERRLLRDLNLKVKYDDFMLEYLKLGHMEAVTKDLLSAVGYHIPHHAVFKSHDSSGKVRVVFDASFATSSGQSLNDCLLTGPRLQSDLWLILTRWRFFKIAFVTDIVKMFRQIRIHHLDSKWQKIVWRLNPVDPLQEFYLTTVTYGTSPAPFLALRVLQQLAQDERHRFPLGAEAIEENSYVDDILSGADTLEKALIKKKQLIDILLSGGFPLSKWSTNTPELCSERTSEDRIFDSDETCNILGLTWSPNNDSFSLRVNLEGQPNLKITKRRVLSDISRLFDPLGWISPVLIFGKIFMQDLWMRGVDWDQDLPEDLFKVWNLFYSNLVDLEKLTVPRWISYSSSNTSRVELHGFCDASERAYAAVVYLKMFDKADNITVKLIVAKTKVAPVKTLSIPRLELCGAVLLSKLIKVVISGLKLPDLSVRCWTDSQVTLAWIGGHASKWKPFISHRVAEIQSFLPAENWSYVSTGRNPADVATRSITPRELLLCASWWNGPPWLQEPGEVSSETTADTNGAELEELKRVTTCHTTQLKKEIDLLERYSTLTRLLRITALCFRFSYNLKHPKNRRLGFITTMELKMALKSLVRIVQHFDFEQDYAALNSNSTLSRHSSILPMRPFIDEEGLLRVGGRLQHSLLPNEEKFPIIIGKDSPLAILLVREAHQSTLHGGPQLTQSFLLRRYWIIRSRNLIRAVIRNCVKCLRFSGKVASQIMAHLPSKRIIPSRPFLHSGVDYAGPIQLRTTKGRGHRAYKGYICLFICLCTKAIHLEVVSDLSSNAFLAAFRRFTSRRGRCLTMHSDNGTNFRGAERELRAMFKAASKFYVDVATSLADDGTSWTFIPPPPHAPHFGGLWEAGVKSVKHHLRRIIGETTLTFEEMTTFLCQVEACLNSRPLYSISSDPSDLLPLTPGHFLVGEPLTSIPEPCPIDDQIPLVSRWKLITNLRNHFWHRWSKEYLHTVQQLAKWRRHRKDLEVGMLVLIKDDLQPPAKWAMGRITHVHLGQDGHIRVVTIKTSSTTLLRPISKICPLPVSAATEDCNSGAELSVTAGGSSLSS